MTRAAPAERSSVMPSVNGPRSFTRTTTVFRVRGLPITRQVPKGRDLWAAVSSSGLNTSPYAVRLPTLSPLPCLLSKGMRRRRPDTGHQFVASENKPTTSEIDSSESELVAWAKLVLAAQLHSEASVTSPTVRFYAPGTVRREGAWFQVLDPVINSAVGFLTNIFHP